MQDRLVYCKCGHEKSLHGITLSDKQQKAEGDTSCTYCDCKKFEEKT